MGTAKTASTSKSSAAKKAAPVKKATAKKAAPIKKVATKKATAPVKATTPAKKAAPVKKAVTKKAAAPVKKAAAKKPVAPVKKATAPAKKAAPIKKVAAKKAAPVKKTTAKKAAPARKAAPIKKVAAKKAAPVKKAAAPAKKAAAKKTTPPAKALTPVKKAAAKKAPTAKKVTARDTLAARTRTVAAPAPTETVQNAAPAPEPRTAQERWRGHPVAANAIRIVAMFVPLAASVVSGVVLSHLISRPHAIGAVLAWWVGIMVASTAVLVGVDRVARRILPLATLLKLSMAFPDQAPSRFSVAARAGTTRSLQEQLRRAQQEGVDDGPAQAAHRILTLVGALGAHDRRTRGHSERVRAFNDLIAEEMRLPQHDRDRLRWAALLHDIGKLHVSARILNKPKKPTEKEWAILKTHPARGARIAAPLADWLGEWAPTIEQHHERWDGAGYPHGVSGADICLGARIVAVADAYEVMTAPRPYSRPVSAAAAREELARCAGAQFDPEVVRAFLNISIGRLRAVIGPISWLAQLPLIGATPRLEAAVGMAGRQVATAAATATGTGVLAAAMLPQAAHAHHHHEHVAHLSAGTFTAHAQTSHAAPPATPAVPPQHKPAAATHATHHSAPAAPHNVNRPATATTPSNATTTGGGTVTASGPTTTPGNAVAPQAASHRTPTQQAKPSAPATQAPAPSASHPPSTQPSDPKPAPPAENTPPPSDPKPDPAPKPTASSTTPPPPPADTQSGHQSDDPQPDHGHDHGH